MDIASSYTKLAMYTWDWYQYSYRAVANDHRNMHACKLTS